MFSKNCIVSFTAKLILWDQINPFPMKLNFFCKNTQNVIQIITLFTIISLYLNIPISPLTNLRNLKAGTHQVRFVYIYDLGLA